MLIYFKLHSKSCDYLYIVLLYPDLLMNSFYMGENNRVLAKRLSLSSTKVNVRGYFLVQLANILIKSRNKKIFFPWYSKICFPDWVSILVHFFFFTFQALNLLSDWNRVSVSVEPCQHYTVPCWYFYIIFLIKF